MLKKISMIRYGVFSSIWIIVLRVRIEIIKKYIYEKYE